MFSFLKDKLKSVVGKFSKKVDEVGKEDIVEVKKEKPKEVKEKKEGKTPSGATNSVDGLNEAYQSKRFKQVVDLAPGVVAAAKTKESKMTANFIYGESLFKLGKLKEAALVYNEYLELGAKGDKVPLVKMRMGDCFRHMGDKATARMFYEELVNKYAKSPQAEKARAQLDKLGDGA